MADPLFDTLFRPTTPSAGIASAAPVRETGTRTRAGNAMNRTRAALLVGARRAVEVSGTKITMAQVAAAAGVAKATLYNHFRTREAVLDALLQDEVATLIDQAAGLPLADALAVTAQALSDSAVLRTLSEIEPGTVAALGRIDHRAAGWQSARAAVESALVADELASASADINAELMRQLGRTPVAAVSHEQFKALTRGARAIVRTGEFSPYANVILRAGVVF